MSERDGSLREAWIWHLFRGALGPGMLVIAKAKTSHLLCSATGVPLFPTPKRGAAALLLPVLSRQVPALTTT
jgi:hypothetical protein